MQNAVAFSNNDVITIAWSYGREAHGLQWASLSTD